MLHHEKLRFVTANFYQLQGLRLVPLGLLLIVLGLAESGSLAWLFDRTNPYWFPVAFLTALLCMIGAALYYRYHYGDVTQHGRGVRNSFLAFAVLGWVLLNAFVDSRLQWPVNLSSLFISACLFATVWIDGRLRAHYLIGGAAWLTVSFLRFFSFDPSVLTLVFYGTGGLTLIVCGVGDHLLITRTLAETENHVSKPAVI